MKLHRTVVVDHLSDFTTTTEWDPDTVTTVRQHGNDGIGTAYLNASQFLGHTTQLSYGVHELVDRLLADRRGLAAEVDVAPAPVCFVTTTAARNPKYSISIRGLSAPRDRRPGSRAAQKHIAAG